MIYLKKSLGQNLLINPRIIEKIIVAANINENDIIIEVGPGTGNLTRKLAQKARRVMVIEKDHRLMPVLGEGFKEYKNIEILEADVLKLDPTALLRYLTDNYCASYKIVANIPYYITSNFLRTVFESASWRMARPKLIVLTIQKEVAQRIMASPPHMNLLALSVQYYSEPEIICYISKNNFRPVPKVDSAIIKLELRITNYELRNREQERKLFNLIRMGFSEKRKQLAPVLAKKLKIPKENILETFKHIGISSTARAENLSLEQWQQLKSCLFK